MVATFLALSSFDKFFTSLNLKFRIEIITSKESCLSRSPVLALAEGITVPVEASSLDLVMETTSLSDSSPS